MTIALVAPGRALGVGGGRRALWAPLRAPAVSGGSSLPTPGGIAGVSGWWDAGVIGSMLDGGGNLIVGWGAAVGSLADKSGSGNPLAVFHAAVSGASVPIATPRVNGILGALGRSTVVPPTVPPSGQYLPIMDPDSGLQLASFGYGASSAWTLYLVWSRPNWRQGAPYIYTFPGPSGVVVAGGVPVVAMGSTAASTALTLFPTGAAVVISANVARRHSHSLILVNTPGVGVSAWLDGTQVASAVSNPLTGSGAVTMLHDTTTNGGAQCWFHEAATWPHALSSGDIATLLTAATRWTRGPRRGINIFFMGQSGAGNAYNDGGWHVLAQGIAWHLGALAYNVIGNYGTTAVGGTGIANVPLTGTVVYGSSFLADPEDGSSPAGWALGTYGTNVEAYLTAWSSNVAADLADIAAIFWPWTETDSIRTYSEKAAYEAAQYNLLGKMRAYLGRTAASLPILLWNAIPFGGGSDPGVCLVREAVADFVTASGQNAAVVLPNTCASLPRGITNYDYSTGTTVPPGQLFNGDGNHRAAADNIGFGRLAAAPAARAILASTGGDTLAAIPTGVPVVGGPRITHVYAQTSKTLILTVAHDTGNDLIVALQALAGAGFAVMDGGSPAAPGAIVYANACARIDATHLLVTLPWAPGNTMTSCLFFYPYGHVEIGTGNVVTDNAASVTPPAGWDIGGDLGSSWSLNFALAATTYGLAISASPG